MLLTVSFYPALRLVLALVAMAIRLRALLDQNKNPSPINDNSLNLQSTKPSTTAHPPASRFAKKHGLSYKRRYHGTMVLRFYGNAFLKLQPLGACPPQADRSAH